MSVFGQIVLPDEPERALVNLLKQWLPDYLAEISRRTGRDQPLRPIQAWGFGDLDNALEDGNLPRLMLECSSGEMIGHGDGYGCRWQTGVGVVVRSTHSMTHLRQLAQAYVTAVSLVLIQHTATVGTGDQQQGLSVSWETHTPSVRDIDTRRWIAQAEAEFTVTAPLVAEVNAGPDVPSEVPIVAPPEYADAEHLSLNVDDAHIGDAQIPGP